MVTAIDYQTVQGRNIRRARHFLGLTQAELAYELAAILMEPWDGAKLSRIENGAQDLTSRELTALATILEQSKDWLTGEEGAQFNDRVNPRYREWGVGRLAYPQFQAAA